MLVLTAAALLAAAFAGCGDDGDSTSASGAGKQQSGQSAGAQSPGSGKQAGEGDGQSGNASGGPGGGSAAQGGASGPKSGSSGGNSGDDGSNSGSQPSKDFLTPGGDNSVQTFGAEGGGDERAAASAAVEAFMAGRASGDWATVCAQMAKGTVEPIEKLIAPGQGCAATLTAAGKRLPASALANTMTGPIDSFRVEGDQGFALWHGNDDADYVLPMRLEGDWKVALLEPTEIL